VSTVDKEIFGSGTFKATLDINGEFLISLPATDTPGFLPVGWSYEVKVYSTVLRIEKALMQVPYTTVGILELFDRITIPT